MEGNNIDIKFGDFTSSAAEISAKPDYAPEVIEALVAYISAKRVAPKVADIGAGTGKLARAITRLGLHTIAVEPNRPMREEGAAQSKDTYTIQWVDGTGENTNLNATSIDWICVGNAFHFMDILKSLSEFYRILKPGGYFTLLWNTPNFTLDPDEAEVQEFANLQVPGVRRTYVFVHDFINKIESIVAKNNLFEVTFFMSGNHKTLMDHNRYIKNWSAIHDIPSQVSSFQWEIILNSIRDFTKDRFSVPQMVIYKTTSITCRKIA